MLLMLPYGLGSSLLYDERIRPTHIPLVIYDDDTSLGRDVFWLCIYLSKRWLNQVMRSMCLEIVCLVGFAPSVLFARN